MQEAPIHKGTVPKLVNSAPPAPPVKATPAPAPAPAPQYYSAPAPQQYTTNTSYSAPLAPLAAAAAPASVPTIDPNAYKSDASYIAQMAALAASKQNYETDFTNKTTQYNTQYADALRNLGFAPAAPGAKDNPATPGIDESKGQWLLNDLNSAAGRSYNSQKNDFGARGLLQSSLYATAMDNLMRSLNDQNTSLNNAKQSYLSGLSTDKAQFEAQNTYQQEQAKQDAMARVLAGLLQS